jgi:hypothetical protein
MSMQLAPKSIIDVTEYELVIRHEADRRYNNNQRTGIEGMTNKTKARIQHTRGAAAEVAARLVMGLDPYAISDDEVGAPDFEHRGVKYDVKSITADYPILNVQHYEGVLERKRDWVIMVMMYEGLGWRFIHAKDILYNNLAYIEPIAATGGHRSTHWRIDLSTQKSDTR